MIQDYTKEQAVITALLKQEPEMMILDMTDSYRNLTLKVKLGYKKVLENYPKAKWIAKADDDHFVNINRLKNYLTGREKCLKDDPLNKMIVIGKILCGERVIRSHKWAENDYKKGEKGAKYPCFPIGSAGHVLSRKAAEFIVDNFEELHNYQGEDVSVGIWMEQAEKLGYEVKFVDEDRFRSVHPLGGCRDGREFIVGHNLREEQMRECSILGEKASRD